MGYMVAYLGLNGSFSYVTARNYFKKNDVFVQKKSFAQIFKAVISGRVDYGIVPYINTTIGTIEEVKKLLEKYNVSICDQIKMDVQLQLLVNKKIDLKSIKKIYSRLEALKQCGDFFKKNPDIEQCVVDDTASAAKIVAEGERTDIAAIAGKNVAKLYGLYILKKNIQNKKNNVTTFIVFKRK